MPKPTQYQGYAEPLPVPAVPPSASWQGYWPETIARKILHAALVPAFFWSSFTPAAAPAVPELSWGSQYPDRLTRPTYPTAEQQAEFWVPGLGNLPIPPLSWEPEYPARLVRPQYLASEQAAEFWVPGLPNLPIPPLSWEPEYPSRLVRPTYPTADQQAEFWTAGLPNLPVPPLGWEPEYPVKIDSRKSIVDQQELFWSGFTPAPAAPVNPVTVVYPDRLQRRIYPTDEQQALFWTGGLPNLPVPPLGWEPEYPNYLFIRRVLGAALRPAFVWSGFTPTPTVSVQFPDRIAARTYLTYEQTAFFGTFVIPVPAPVPPLAWEPTYPDMLRGRPYPVEPRQFLVQIVAPVVGVPIGVEETLLTVLTPDRMVGLLDTDVRVVIVDSDRRILKWFDL